MSTVLDEVQAGRSYPLGASVQTDGVNFAVYSKNADCLELLLFDTPDDEHPARVIRLEPERHRTFHYWHVFLPGLRAGQLYAWRAHGPFEVVGVYAPVREPRRLRGDLVTSPRHQ